MIYEGALIQRLVTPKWPGDPALDAAGAAAIRTEYVRRDQPGEDVAWTLKRDEGQHYPTHLTASIRAKELGAHCHASVVGGDRTQENELSGGVESRHAGNSARNRPMHHCASPGAGENREDHRAETEPCHGDVVRLPDSGSSAPPTQTNLPAESSSSGRAPERLRSCPEVRVVKQSGSRVAGRTLKRKRTPSRGRLAALRLAQERVELRDGKVTPSWWQTGQYA